MRWVFWVALLFAAAVGLALFTELNLSNVVLFYPPYRVEMSLNFVLAALLAARAAPLCLTPPPAVRPSSVPCAVLVAATAALSAAPAVS